MSLTCISCKRLEHNILHNTSSKLNEKLTQHQHGLRKRLSCTTQLLTATQSVVHEVDTRGCVLAAVFDLSKAFNKMPHFLLLRKMKISRCSQKIFYCVLGSLSDKRQQVLLQGNFLHFQTIQQEYSSMSKSDHWNVMVGYCAPTPSIYISINYISMGLRSYIILFADD